MDGLQKPRSSSSIYKGVGWNKQHRRWVAWFYAHGRKTHLGNFKTEVEAALAHDKRALNVLGERAELNFK